MSIFPATPCWNSAVGRSTPLRARTAHCCRSTAARRTWRPAQRPAGLCVPHLRGHVLGGGHYPLAVGTELRAFELALMHKRRRERLAVHCVPDARSVTTRRASRSNSAV